MNVQLTREEGRFVCEIEPWHRIQFHSERLSYNLLLAVAAMIGVLTFILALGNHSDPQVLWVSLPLALVTALLFAIYLLGTHRLNKRQLIASVLGKLR